MQKISVIGFLGSDPASQALPSGSEVVKFSVASNQKVKGEDVTTWFNVNIFGKQGEIALKYLTKGSQIFVDGTLNARAYMNKAGEPAVGLDIQCNSFQMLGSQDGATKSKDDLPF